MTITRKYYWYTLFKVNKYKLFNNKKPPWKPSHKDKFTKPQQTKKISRI